MGGKQNSDSAGRGRIEYVDIMRGVCILLVYYFHSSISLFLAKYASDICVHPFLFISGYFYSRKASFADSARKKLRSMIVPYYIIGLFFYFVWLIAFSGSGRDIIDPLSSVLYMPSANFPIEPSLYFLPMMFFSLMIFTLIEKNIRAEGLRALIILTLTLLGNYWTRLISVRLPMSLDMSMSLILYIYLGYHGRTILGFLDAKLAKIKSSAVKVLLFIAAAVLNYIAIDLSPIANILNGEWGCVPMSHLNTCTIMLLWIYFFRWFDTVRFLEPVGRALKFIGKNSMIFMCFNHVGLKISEIIVSHLPLPTSVQKLLYYALSVITVLPIVALFNRTKLHLIFGKKQ